jgi:hypothetical protein
MRGLSEREILPLWERGAGHGPLGRGRALLAAACPELDERGAAALTIGERDALLLELRERSLGPALVGFVACPECGEPLELELDSRQLRMAAASGPSSEPEEVVVDDERVRFRSLTCGDLDAAAAAGDPEAARRALAELCLLEPAELSQKLLAELSTALAERDPGAEMLVGLTCPECGHVWETVFDIVTFLWSEVTAYARRLLHEVATLAHSFGWRESEILELTAARRRHYLELAS